MIVHIITELAQGGAESALFRLLEAEANPQSNHVVCLSDDGVFGARIRKLGIPVTTLRMRQALRIPLGFVRLVELLNRLRPDLVQTWMYHANVVGGLAARLAGIPVCWSIRQSNLSPSVNKLSTLCVAKVGAWMSRSVPDRIVSCSARAVETHTTFGYASKFVVIANGIDTGAFTADHQVRHDMRLSLNIPQGVPLVGHIGRFDTQKDYPTLLAACAKLKSLLPSVKIVLCGKNIDFNNDALTSHVRAGSLEDHVQLLGPRDDIRNIMRALDVCVLSSAGEAFPNVILEAMSSEVPCVVTDVGDAPEIVGETGWVVPPSDPGALAAALFEALQEPSGRRLERGRAARRRIMSEFTIRRMRTGFESVWREVKRERSLCAE